jgi:hypothetical protein
MKNYGKINSLAQIEESEYPQFISGRILPVASLLTAPISGKSCVYYDVRVEQLVEKTDENGLVGEIEGNKVWEYRCGETVAADFTLYDPAYPSLDLYVPGTQVPIKVHATEDVKTRRSKVIKHSKLPQHTKVKQTGNILKTTLCAYAEYFPLFVFPQEFLANHKFSAIDANGNLSKNMRFREASFEFGEQIAVLGIVKKFVDETGAERKVLFPVSRIFHVLRLFEFILFYVSICF